MNMGSFADGIDRLGQHVGHGTLELRDHIDQVYAHYQHEDLSLSHPHGGQARYLGQPLLDKSGQMMHRLADRVTELDAPLGQAMIDNARTLQTAVAEATPVLWGNLRGSQHLTVTDDGAMVYDLPAEVGRLSEQELRLLSDLITTETQRAIFKQWWRKHRAGAG